MARGGVIGYLTTTPVHLADPVGIRGSGFGVRNSGFAAFAFGAPRGIRDSHPGSTR